MVKKILFYLIPICLWSFPTYAIEDVGAPLTMHSAATSNVNGTDLRVRGYTSVAVQVTISGTATVTFKTTVDGSTYENLACSPSTGGSASATATATGLYQCTVAGMNFLQAPISNCAGCTVTVIGQPSTSSARSGAGGGSGLPAGGTVGECVINTGSGTGDWDTCPGAAGGDSVTVNGSAVTDPDFATTGSDLTLTNTANVITFTLKSGLTVTNWTMVNPALGTPASVVLTNATGTAASLTAGTATVANSGDSATSFFSSGTIEDARLPSSMADKTITGSLGIPNSTSLPGTCSIGMIYFDNDATAGVNLYGCTASNTWTLLGDGGGAAAVATDTIWDAAGDLAVGSGANTAVRLAKGNDGDVLTVTGGNVAWVAGGGGLTHPQTMARASIGF